MRRFNVWASGSRASVIVLESVTASEAVTYKRGQERAFGTMNTYRISEVAA